jgi:hypothetical protein
MLVRRGLHARRSEPIMKESISLMYNRQGFMGSLRLSYLAIQCSRCPQPIPKWDRGVVLVILGDACDLFDTLGWATGSAEYGWMRIHGDGV